MSTSGFFLFFLDWAFLQHGVNTCSHHSNKSFTPTNFTKPHVTTNLCFSNRENIQEFVKIKRSSDGCCCCLWVFLCHKSLPAPQGTVYLQQSPAVVTKAARQQHRASLFFPASPSYGLKHSSWKQVKKKKTSTVVDCY